ncbi:MAG: pilus assembly protein [Bacilli bacterium]|nr:pilus assembly protein [Bacilli bacterium]
MDEDKNKFNLFKLAFLIVVLIFFTLLIIDCSRIIYYQFKLNNAEIKIENKYDGRYDEVNIKKDIDKEFLVNTDFVERNEDKYVEYKYYYHVKLLTPPFNLIFSDGFKLKGEILINK